jgi:hypothetical protein
VFCCSAVCMTSVDVRTVFFYCWPSHATFCIISSFFLHFSCVSKSYLRFVSSVVP